MTSQDIVQAIQTRNIKSLVYCYASEVKADFVDSDGNNILHLAAKTNNASIVKAVLLLYERRYHFSVKKNKSDNYPKDLSYSPEISDAIKLFRPFKKDCELPPDKGDRDVVLEFEEKINDKNISVQRFEHDHGHKERSILLSLDGGGIRGLVLVQMLMYLEERLRSSIWKRFNWVSGTSTGGILACALSKGRSLEECRMLYLRLKEELFVNKNKPYDTLKLETVLKEVLGIEKMSSIKHPKLVIPTCLANVAPPVLKLFRSFAPPMTGKELASFGYEDPETISIWKAARCSSAAPLFFTAVEDKYVDGGLMANNPILELLTECIRYQHIMKRLFKKDSPPIGCVLSLGTGESPTKTIGAGRYNAMLKAVSKKGAEVKSMLQVGLRQLTEADGQPVDRAQAWCWSMNVPFFRFSPQLQQTIEMDESNDAVLLEMLWATEVYMRSEATQVGQLIRLLDELKSNSNI